MTVLDFTTDSTTAPPRPPDRARAWPGAAAAASRPSLAAIVTSLHGRTGKTLLARVLADYFLLAGDRPVLFDTDTTERTLHNWFPEDTFLADLVETRDQMLVFDTMVARSRKSRIVDVSHYAYKRFFKVMEESNFVAEARMRNVEPIIFYIADRNPDAYEEAQALRERFADSTFALVENAFVGRVKDQTRRSSAYRVMMDHDLRISIPPLDLAIAEALDDPAVSLSDIMSRPLSRDADEHPAGLYYEEQTEVRRWLVHLFREIHRASRAAESRAATLAPAE